jgi:tetratricopeptide (TPR) repeat protein
MVDNRSQEYQLIQDTIEKRDYARAGEMISSHLEKDPDSPDAHYLKGVLNYFEGKIGPTIESLRRALSLDSSHTDAAICLSVLLNDIGRYDEAKRVFDQANQSVARNKLGEDFGIDAKFAVKHLELADLYVRYRRYDEAIEEYGKAALLDPSVLDIRIRLAKVYAKKGYLTRAMQELQQLKHEHPRYIPARVQLGLLHYSQRNVLDAELEWESILDIEPQNREAFAYLEMAKKSRLT